MRKLVTAGLALTLGCSATVDDLRRAPFNSQFCDQSGNSEVIRDAHIEFDEMQAHTSQRTVLTLLGGPQGARSIRAKALIRFGFSAAQGGYDPGHCTHLGPVRDDGSRRLLMSFDIPNFVPADGAGNDPTGGPYVLEFWSDANNDGRLGMVANEATDPAGEDHLWVRPMCTDGNVYFVHAGGLDDPETLAPRQRGGNFTFTLGPGVVTAVETVGATGILQAPMVVEATWEGQTVAYIRTVLACDPDSTWEVRRVIDTGSVHSVRVYWDMDRNGSYTTDCDPVCTLNEMSDANGLNVTLGVARVMSSCAAPRQSSSPACQPSNP